MKLTLVLLLFCGLAGAQSSTPLGDKPWDIGIWAGGGFSVPGGTSDTQVINAGVRLGKVLTGEHGGGFMRGNFEWAADGMPLYVVVQPRNTAYGAAFNPVNLKWNFTASHRVVPYLELGGGVLFTNTEVPAFTSTTNFLTHAALGFQFFRQPKRAITFTTRYEHISNAGLSTPNPGINTVQFTIGYNWLK
jgi:hypothetical protein